MWCIWDVSFSMDINLVNLFLLKDTMTFSQRPTCSLENINGVMDVLGYDDSICYHPNIYISTHVSMSSFLFCNMKSCYSITSNNYFAQ
jgi:hypothetical protein